MKTPVSSAYLPLDSENGVRNTDNLSQGHSKLMFFITTQERTFRNTSCQLLNSSALTSKR